VSPGRRPRVLILITLAEVGGAQTYVAHLLPALAERYDVTLAAWGPGPLVDAARAAGVAYVPLRNVRRAIGPRDALGLLELVRLMLRLRPDVVHTNSSKASILGRTAAAIARVPIRLFTVNGWAFNAHAGAEARLFTWAHRLVRPLTTAVICVSETERRQGLEQRTCTARQAVVIHNGVDVAAAKRSDLGGVPPLVLSVTRLKDPKDTVTFARALRRLEPGSFRAAIVGGGPERPQVEAELGDAGELLGERDDVPELLASADVFALSSRSEGLPLSILEAMAAGLPVVATAVGGIPELVVDGETGLLVPPGDAQALADALRRLLGDPSLRRRFGDAARERAERDFSVERVRRAHVDLYERLLAGGMP
jgi:glycosyltransferase involved in cell wall biosynthesis